MCRRPVPDETPRVSTAPYVLGVLVLVAGAVLLARTRAATRERALLVRRLEEQRAVLAEVAVLAGLGSFTCDPVTRVFAFTDELFALWGVAPGSPLRDDPEVFARDVLHPEDQPFVRAAFDAGLAHGGRHDVEFRITRVDTGEQRHVRSTVEVVLGRDGRPRRITGAQVDVTDLVLARLEAQDVNALHGAVLAATPDVVVVTDLRAQAPVYVSPSILTVLGQDPQATVALGRAGRTQHVHPDDVVLLDDADRRTAELPDGGVVQVRYRCRHADGHEVWVQRRATPFQRDADGEVVQVLGVVRDITDVVRAEEQLAHAALHDPLTGLPNRTLLARRLQQAVDAAHRGETPAPVLVYLDLDGFKRVNDDAGHAAGDAVLREVARRLLEAVGPDGTVARLGGDEFVVLLPPVDDALERALEVADALQVPVQVAGTGHLVRASGGVVVAEDGLDVEQLLADADTAMYRAKALGKDRLQLFEQGLRDELAERLRVERVLRQALEPVPVVPRPRAWPTLSLAYQPVVDGAGEVVGVEALARLRDEQGRAVPPDVFVPVAEVDDLVRTLGVRVLDLALGQLAAWRATGRDRLTMAVNVSAREAQDAGFAGTVLDALDRHGLVPADLVLELTETVLLEAGPSTLAALERLHGLGVRIAIDDFGTGYASLRYLTQLPVDLLKVDRMFTAGLPHDVACATVVRAVIGLAEDLGLGCVVEGVETREQRDALPSGVHLQGYLLGRPLPADEVDLGRRLALR